MIIGFCHSETHVLFHIEQTEISFVHDDVQLKFIESIDPSKIERPATCLSHLSSRNFRAAGGCHSDSPRKQGIMPFKHQEDRRLKCSTGRSSICRKTALLGMSNRAVRWTISKTRSQRDYVKDYWCAFPRHSLTEISMPC